MSVDLTRWWYQKSLHPLLFPLLPFSFLFGACAAIRRGLYRSGLMKTYRPPVPVIVVGNITVGGTGKTPFVIWLAQLLQREGYRPGIVSRGVGGKKQMQPYWVLPDASPSQVGDEAVLLAQHTSCPVVVGINRTSVVRELLQKTACDIIISDDGLQHYRLERDIEIAMVDGSRELGNKCLLPAGPLREQPNRLRSVDFVVINGGAGAEITMDLKPAALVSLHDPTIKISLSDFPEKKIHAAAGIGHPERFFLTLKNAGFEVVPHCFKDHYLYAPADLEFGDSLPVVMTEKDAVKCKQFAKKNAWYMSVEVKVSNGFEQALLSTLRGLAFS